MVNLLQLGPGTTSRALQLRPTGSLITQSPHFSIIKHALIHLAKKELK